MTKMPINALAPTAPQPSPVPRETSDELPDVPEMSFAEFMDKIGSISFSDVLDVINPLQHIPVISTLYRSITGDEISNGARIAGGALYGGPVGVAVASMVASVETMTGTSLEKQIASSFGGNEDETVKEPAAIIASAQGVTPPHNTKVKLPVYPAVPTSTLSPVTTTGILAAKPDTSKATEDARIAEAVASAQKAQASLLLATVSESERSAQSAFVEDPEPANKRAEPPPAKNAAHPWKLPASASDAEIAGAMMQALQKYEKAIAGGNAR